jgi:hypothetical protein
MVFASSINLRVGSRRPDLIAVNSAENVVAATVD